MTAMQCSELAEVGPELILGILAGDERAAAIAHLEGCPRCQQEVSSLAGLTDQLLLLSPVAQPSAGFEERVLAALVHDEPLSPRRGHVRWRSAVAALALAACLTLAAMLGLGGGTPAPAFATGQMRTDRGAVVGEVWLHRERPAVMFMSLPGWEQQLGTYSGSGATFAVRVERTDGSALDIPARLSGDSWMTELSLDPSTVSSVAIVDSNGRVWCQANLLQSAASA
jgi:hypothetical protein